MRQHNRVEFLDGMRGLAILMVVCLHYFVQLYHVPRSDYYDQKTPLHYLDFGVPLFFIISGYVIFMTLERNRNFLAFIYRRWVRLFPAMVAATVFIVAASLLLPLRPGGVPRMIDLAPGLSLIGAKAISILSGTETQGLERGFWSVYVEFRFYVLFGATYYLLGRQKSFSVLLTLSMVLLALTVAAESAGHDYARIAHEVCGKMLIGQYLPWFLIGMHIYLYGFQDRWGVLLLIVASAIAYHSESLGSVAAVLIVFFVVLAAFRNEWTQRLFAGRALLFLGFVSYPLYLVNDSVGRGAIFSLYRAAPPWLPFEVLSIAVLVPMVLVAWLIARFVEPPAQSWLKKYPVRTRAGAALIGEVKQ